MSINVNCPNCGKGYLVSEENLGRRATCKGCDQKFILDNPESTPDGDNEEAAHFSESGLQGEAIDESGPSGKEAELLGEQKLALALEEPSDSKPIETGVSSSGWNKGKSLPLIPLSVGLVVHAVVSFGLLCVVGPYVFGPSAEERYNTALELVDKETVRLSRAEADLDIDRDKTIQSETDIFLGLYSTSFVKARGKNMRLSAELHATSGEFKQAKLETEKYESYMEKVKFRYEEFGNASRDSESKYRKRLDGKLNALPGVEIVNNQRARLKRAEEMLRDADSRL